MKKLNIGIIDLVTKAPTRSMWGRIMHANFASIMPQAVAAWCEQEGHNVTFMCYTGFEDLSEEIPEDIDIIFISAFSQAAQLSYALSNMFRNKGIVTVLGGPHARCYPQDAIKYFDYVVGFTDKSIIREILQNCVQNRPIGIFLSAKQQPPHVPGVKERWKFIDITLKKAPLLKVVPMIGSLGCPYTCNFCIDALIPYQPLSFEVIKEDLRFLLTKFKRPKVGWHDPNFGIRFNDYLDIIEEAVPPGSIDFFAESSLSLLSEDHLKRLRKNSFKAIMPGIESWFDMGNKSKTGKKMGIEKVKQVADHINMILSYIPYLQANLVFGLDNDEGPDPFELTKLFVDLAPGAYPAYTLLSAFGQAAPLNLEYQRENRIIPIPFHFLNTQHAMNVRPKNYEWVEFFEYLCDLTSHTF
ncbi:MAG: radical SAM protein, partial [Calditrichaeota bacterium]